MATYREIRGLRVPYLDADPPSASASTQEGQLWYNSSTGKLRGFVAYDTWATGSPLNTARQTTAAAGTQTAGMIFGGDTPPATGATEEYNGSGWSESGDLNTARAHNHGAGTQTAGLCFGGTPGTKNESEEYDGSSWTEGDNLNTGRRKGAGFGIQTAAVLAGGITSTANVEE